MSRLEKEITNHVEEEIIIQRNRSQTQTNIKIYEKKLDDPETIKTSITYLGGNRWKIRVVTNIAPNKLNNENGIILVDKLIEIVKSMGSGARVPVLPSLKSRMIGKNLVTTIDINIGKPVSTVKDAFPKYCVFESAIYSQLSSVIIDLTLIDKDVCYYFQSSVDRQYITMRTSVIVTTNANNTVYGYDRDPLIPNILMKEINKWKLFHSSFKIPKITIALSQSPTTLIKILSNTLSSTTDTDNVVDIILSYMMHSHTTYDY